MNTIGTMLVNDDSLSQRQIALIGILQTTVKKIIPAHFFTAVSIGVYIYAFTRNVRMGGLFLRYRADCFTGDVTNPGLHAVFFTFSICGISDS